MTCMPWSEEPAAPAGLDPAYAKDCDQAITTTSRFGWEIRAGCYVWPGAAGTFVRRLIFFSRDVAAPLLFETCDRGDLW